jgi:hypothetical protein
MKGNLRLSSNLLSHLKQLTTQLEPGVLAQETQHITPLEHAQALPCPYSWTPALPEDYEALTQLTQPVHEVQGANVVGVVAPARNKKTPPSKENEKTVALILAEILVFGHEG